ncbi:putative bifunctional diguanylate cyclase/phosphodiesterase [Fusibacter ferrireducens]|uniref:EAL domain-containing protein n=1 Tax=Fusibacter ferrireducens TaxID=2785058 RepID=A0ABR9ZYR4_9FIRM|nr:GGDEF domain-containing phosphodiesterase [Fusibacter ferrireducens]MBF4695587.1 EAL domain-containing protein [Fusibacter ferrireducens]
MIKKNIYQMHELTTNRQRLSIKIYAFIYIIGLLGSSISIISNPLNTVDGKLKQLIPVGIVITFSLVMLYVLYRAIGKVNWIDKGIFVMTLLLYGIITVVSIGKILSVVIWVPIFIVFLFTLMDIKLSYILITVHLIVTILYNMKYPAYHYEVTKSTYVSMYTIILILLITVPKVLNLFQDYQKKISEDNEALLKKNKHVNVLLEDNAAKNMQLTEIAYKDAVTNLLNRQGFIKALGDCLEKTDNRDLSVLLIDIVQFRNINSVYGYGFGDKVLRKISELLGNPKFKAKHIARVGNDTFAVVITDLKIDELEKRINKDLGYSIFLEELSINIKYRIGISACNSNKKTAEILLNEADIALSKTKELHTMNYFIYDLKLDYEIKNRFSMIWALDQAIETKQIFMVYQPIYDMAAGKVVSVEALARWQDDVFGNISPDVFIELAEKSTLIHPLGDLIIESVCQFARRLDDVESDCCVTINISSRQLGREDFAEMFLEQIDAYSINPQKIGVEITESILIERFELVVEHLNRLRNRGIKIYLDDFGTGYSSLNYLDQLPIDVLKIDKSFVDEILISNRKRHILETIISLARQFDLNVLAEGVETREQAELLEKMGVHRMQGYYYSMPLKENEVYHAI